MQALDTTIVNTALPSIAREQVHRRRLHAHHGADHACVPGWLADRFGTRRMYLVSIALFVIGSLACASAHTLNQQRRIRRVSGDFQPAKAN